MSKNPKVIVIGLDGATWDLIKPWADEGKLPTFKHLMDEGARGKLESTTPPITFPAIPSFITGKVPQKHGVFNFYNPTTDGRLGIIDGRKIDSALNKINKKIIVGFIYPGDLRQDLRPYIEKYKIDADFRYIPGKERKYLDELKKIAFNRVLLAKHLAENYNWELLLVYFIILDRVGHHLWKDEYLLEAYQHIDNLLKEFITLQRKSNSYLIIFSDHGFGKSKGRFYPNSWLLSHGFLSLKTPPRVGIQTFISILFRFPKNILKFIPLSLATKILNRFRESGDFFDKIDLKNTGAYATISGFHITHPYDSREYHDTKDKIIDSLRQLEIDGRRLNVEINTYDVNDPSVPDIVYSIENYQFEPFPGFHRTRSIIEFGKKSIKGWHRKEAIFYVCGPEINKEKRIGNAVMWDLAPTILFLLNRPIPREIDGKVLKGIFEENSDIAQREIKYTIPAKKHIKETTRRSIKKLIKAGQI
jgi:predicted AlkP superfamily phosphohydrolase/phosphomutase